MDRHEFVGRMLAKRELLQKNVAAASAERAKAFQRSWKGLAELLRPLLCENEERLSCVSRSNSSWSGLVTIDVDEQLKVDDASIIHLCSEITDLQEQLQEIQDATAKLKEESCEHYFRALFSDDK